MNRLLPVILMLMSACATTKVKVEEQEYQQIDIKKEVPPLKLEQIKIEKENNKYYLEPEEMMKLYNNCKELKTKFIWLKETYNNDIDTLLIIVNKKSVQD